MSMIGHVRQITPAQFDDLQRHPETIRNFLYAKAKASAPNMIETLQRVQELGLKAREIKDPMEREKASRTNANA